MGVAGCSQSYERKPCFGRKRSKQTRSEPTVPLPALGACRRCSRQKKPQGARKPPWSLNTLSSSVSHVESRERVTDMNHNAGHFDDNEELLYRGIPDAELEAAACLTSPAAALSSQDRRTSC
jgi:hypothetical protein